MLESALTCGENLRMNPRCVLVSKEGRIPAPDHPRVIEQKQKGLYSVLYHPVGGSPKPSFFREIYNVIRDMEQVELRLTPGGAVYIINCDGREAAGVLKVTRRDGLRGIGCLYRRFRMPAGYRRFAGALKETRTGFQGGAICRRDPSTDSHIGLSFLLRDPSDW